LSIYTPVVELSLRPSLRFPHLFISPGHFLLPFLECLFRASSHGSSYPLASSEGTFLAGLSRARGHAAALEGFCGAFFSNSRLRCRWWILRFRSRLNRDLSPFRCDTILLRANGTVKLANKDQNAPGPHWL
jgi:hypothetical protein